MAMLLALLSMKTIKSMQPMHLAISILTISIVSAASLFKTTMSSWLPFVVILTFSSGMMTLFMYTASFSPNEKTMKNKKNLTVMAPVFLLIAMPLSNVKMTKKTMKTFTSMAMFFVMAVILIMTMISISNHGHHPNQTVSASF